MLIINVDSKIKNIALEKIKMYYKDYEEQDADYYKTLFYNPDKYESVWVSCVFDWNKDKALAWKDKHKKVYIGGSGVDYKAVLPPHIDSLKPKINMGFTTRGCPRKCEFCIVPEKEGKIKATGDIYDIWDGKSKEIVLLDNNILAMPKHFFKITEQIKKEGLKVDFNQGLDCRLLTREMAMRLGELKHNGKYRFAFDFMGIEKFVDSAIMYLRKAGIDVSFWYVYTDGDIDNALYRINYLRDKNQKVYLMRDRKIVKRKDMIQLARWCNSVHGEFFAMTWEKWKEAGY